MMDRPRRKRQKKSSPESTVSTCESFAESEARWAEAGRESDNLLCSPPISFPGYVKPNGKTMFDSSYVQQATYRPPPVGANHPKIGQAKASGNWTPRLQNWYQEFRPCINIPLAGVSSEPDALGFRRTTAARQAEATTNKPKNTIIEPSITTRAANGGKRPLRIKSVRRSDTKGIKRELPRDTPETEQKLPSEPWISDRDSSVCL
jgi:hypothetical protein